jgi:hypothetical protein
MESNPKSVLGVPFAAEGAHAAAQFAQASYTAKSLLCQMLLV